jgi:aryl-alcohol dehydrogenase-like predicted oxidoreductase
VQRNRGVQQPSLGWTRSRHQNDFATYPALRFRPTKFHRLEENIGAVAVELTADDLREIRTASSQIKIEGARYPEHIERMTGR